MNFLRRIFGIILGSNNTVSIYLEQNFHTLTSKHWYVLIRQKSPPLSVYMIAYCSSQQRHCSRKWPTRRRKSARPGNPRPDRSTPWDPPRSWDLRHKPDPRKDR